MCKQVEVRKNIILRIDFATNSSVLKDINLDFIPDEMKVRYSHYLYDGRYDGRIITAYAPTEVDFTSTNQAVPVPVYGGTTNQETDISLLYCDIVNDNIATIVDNGQLQTYNTCWTIKKPVKNTYRFTITTDGGLDIDRRGSLILHLEFIKYK